MSKIILRGLLVLALAAPSFLLVGPPTVVNAAQPVCHAYHRVYQYETLRMISRVWNVPAWDIRQANKAMMIQPSYPVLLGGRLCIPYPTGTTRTLPAYILDAPPATVVARAIKTGRYPTLQLTVTGFAPNENWTVKINNKKVGKFLALKKNAQVFTYRLPSGNPTQVCIKDQLTDYAQCYPIYYPKK